MKAILQTGYGDAHDVVEIGEIAKPVPQEDEVLVRVRAASLHPDVWHVIVGRPYVLRIMGGGFRRPKNPVPGIDLAGVVEAVGSQVTRFRPGDEVFGECVRGHQWQNGGAFAEYAAVRETALAFKPTKVSFEQAAALATSGFIAIQGIRDQGRLEAGQSVLINGAGGGVGTMAVQLAKAWGAHVTAVDAGEKLDTLRAIGADEVIDYAKDDFTLRGERYDLLLDIPGNHAWRDLRRVIAPHGRYVLIGHDLYGARGHRWFGSMGRFLRLTVLSLFVKRLRASSPKDARADRLDVLVQMAASGRVVPVVDKSYTLEEIQQALAYLQTGDACGKVVITP